MTTNPSPEVAALTLALGNALGTAARPAVLIDELRRALGEIRGLFSAAACSCARVDTSGESLTFIAADGEGAVAIVGVHLPIARGVAGWVASSGQPILTGELSGDQRFARDVAEATDYVPDTIMAAPILDADGETIGVIEVLDPVQRGTHAGQDLDTLATMANQIGAIIRLGEVYDSLGATLLQAMAGAATTEDFAAGIAELRASRDADELVAAAEAFASIATTGPEGFGLATRILLDVARFAKVRR